MRFLIYLNTARQRKKQVPEAGADRTGFTLIEVLCVIALIGSITAWVAYNQTGLGTFLTRLTPEEVFRRAVQEARFQASMNRAPVELSWDANAQSFRFQKEGQPIAIEPELIGLDRLFSSGSLEISFAASAPREGPPSEAGSEEAMLREPRPLRLRFLPTGVSQPGSVIFQSEGEAPRRLTLDAFSSGADSARSMPL